ncbi:carbamoyl-phosphate synthase large subunit [Candidatus Vidania fulgoroideorum]
MKKVLVIGSGAIVIGQACEFDYSGVQVCKAFRRENIKTILINNNPATVMTDKNICYKTYIEPINISSVINIINKENIKYIYPCSGGQTALNLAVKLIKKKKINILGPSLDAIKKSESRKKFRRIMKKNKIKTSISYIAINLESALKIRKKIINKTNKKEISIRPSYTLGGLGGSIVKNKKQFIENYNKCLLLSGNNEVIIEESLYGYKELELEILKDISGNFIVVCSIENFDPVGVHTGDSICFSPIQTLTDKEFQEIRNCSKKVIKLLNIKKTGANIQYAINPNNGSFYLIEVNPRLSRSSALASKATGYPIATISANISLGKKIFKIKNKNIGIDFAFFEPTIDYVVSKFPVFSHEKFSCNNIVLNSQMKAVGESMSISKIMERSIQLGLCNDNSYGFENESFEKMNILKKIYYPNHKRVHNIYEFIKQGYCIKKISKISKIDIFFIKKIYNIVKLENEFKKKKHINKKNIKKLKKYGFSDEKVSKFFNLNCKELTHFRLKKNIAPSLLRVDGCSNEYNKINNYFYTEYGCKNEFKFKKKITVVIGSGPNRIGQGIEFDYCCVHSLNFLKKNNIFSAVINNNPETVSTDSNISDFLFFSPVNFESIIDIKNKINLKGLIVQFCGQLSSYLIKYLIIFNINVLGTKLKNILDAEDRKLFFTKIKGLDIIKPENNIVKKSLDFVKLFNNKFPILVRPSFVLGGKDMIIINNKNHLNNYYKKFIATRSINYPLTVDSYLKENIEIDVDGIRSKKKTYIFPLLQQIEKTGIHSGDSSSFFPNLIGKKNEKKIIEISKEISKLFNIIGSFNIQYSIDPINKKIYIIELNPRVSRSVPFLSKATNIDITYLSMKSIFFNKFKLFNKKKSSIFFIKDPIFSFEKYKNSSLILGPEMKSTGEIICYSKKIKYAFYKSIIKKKKFFLFKKVLLVGSKDIYLFLKLRKKNINIFYLKNIKFKGFFYNNFYKTIIVFEKRNKKKKNKYLETLKYYDIPIFNDINKIYFSLINKKKKINFYNSINLLHERN